jgi:glycine C-acetyltransferase/8-amino-7-oxononanoate synthase
MVDAARSSSIDDMLRARLDDHDARAVRRRLRPLESGIGPRVLVDGRSVIQLCSNDYLGLASHPAVTRAAAEAALEYGAGAGSARLIVGTSAPHAALERDIARLKGTEAALVLSSGYHANTGVLPILAGDADAIFSDELNHASLIDGCRLSRADVRVYRHADPEHLDRLLHDSAGFRRRLIVTETVFGMDGDLAPLADLVHLARRHDAWLVVDEAHATGVFGGDGGGLVSQLGLTDLVDVQIGTLSKALGSLGGYVAGSAALIDWVVNAARTFIYTTALPPAAVAAARAAIAVLAAEPERRQRVWSHAARLRERLADLGFQLRPTRSPILPILVGDAESAVRLADTLLERGVLAPAIRPPTVPEGTARLRVAPMATHTAEDLATAVDAFAAAAHPTGRER